MKQPWRVRGDVIFAEQKRGKGMAYKKYFTLSFDDGLEQDKKIIRILKECGLRDMMAGSDAIISCTNAQILARE